MGKSIISVTAINRMISAYNSYSKKSQRTLIINQNKNLQTERNPEYALHSVEFVPETRVTRIEFMETKQYRTIVKYVQQNYVKYPVYSEWKIKRRFINKTIRLTNMELESLNSSDDQLLKHFAEDIILKINLPELFPSWLVKKVLKHDTEENLAKLKMEHESFLERQKGAIKKIENEIKEIENELPEKQKAYNKTTRKKEKIESRINKINDAKNVIVKAIFTLGIYSYLVSKYRRIKLVNKRNELNKKIDQIGNEIENVTSKVNKNRTIIERYNWSIRDRIKKYNKDVEEEKTKYSKEYNSIKPLESFIIEDSGFKSLKTFSGLEKQKIVGCYIIRNRENDKCYVGQSKDVLKRIKQHFAGTIPKNSIFAEDYYTSQYIDKSELFEVKIIPCNTKDELDRKEAELIKDYDAQMSGYNSTSGNK